MHYYNLPFYGHKILAAITVCITILCAIMKESNLVVLCALQLIASMRA